MYGKRGIVEFRSEEMGYSGRYDVVVGTKKYIYIIELKVDEKAESGMNQIKDRQYFFPYLNNENYKDKGIVLISISFDSNTKEIKDHLVETIR